MSSIQSSFAQPKTTRLVSLSTGRIVTEAQVTSALTAVYGISYSQVGTLYVVDTVGHLEAFATAFESAGVALSAYETLIDMGKNLTFGVLGVDGTILRFRLVKRTKGAGTLPTDNLVGYVLVENDSSVAAVTGTLVKVARV